jgi:hypothetical protein
MPYLDLNAATASITTALPTFTNMPACLGDTLTVRSLGSNQKATLIDFGVQGSAANVARVRSPFLHDDVQGIRSRYLAADASGLTGNQPNQALRGQDTLIVESSGTGAALQYVAWLLTYYDNLDGPSSRYITAHELLARSLEETATEVTTTSGAVAGQWGTALLSTGSGIWKANQEYAVYGYELDVACAAVGLLGPDTGNFRAGGPGILTRQFTRNWFFDLSAITGLPCIPVINAQNITGTQVSVNHFTAATVVNVNWLLARLK